MQNLITRESASDRLGVPMTHVNSMVENGELAAIDIAGNLMLDCDQVARNPMARALAPSFSHTRQLLAKCLAGSPH